MLDSMEITIWDEFPNSGLQLCYLPFYNYVTDLAFRAPGGGIRLATKMPWYHRVKTIENPFFLRIATVP